MQEIFYEEASIVKEEESEKRKYNTLNILSWLLLLLIPVISFIVITSYNFNNFPLIGIVLVVIPVGLCLFFGIFFGRKKNKHCIDYDYTFITGSIRIAQVIKHTKRKFVMEFETREIEKIGKVGSVNYKKYENLQAEYQKLTSNETPSENKDFYYFAINNGGKKQVLTLELTEKFIATILKFTNKATLLDEDYLKELKMNK